MKIYENLDINDLNGEIWKIIIDFSNYQISNLGRIKRVIHDRWNHKLKILKQQKNNKGYLYVNLYKNKKMKHKLTHILLFETFNDYKLKNECVHHIDENKENNYYYNLEKMTKSKHRQFHTLGQKHPLYGKNHTEETKNKMSQIRKEKFNNKELDQSGEKNNNSILICQDIIQIKLLLKEGKLNHRIYSQDFWS